MVIKEWMMIEIIVYKDDPDYDKKINAIQKLINKYNLQDFWQDAEHIESDGLL